MFTAAARSPRTRHLVAAVIAVLLFGGCAPAGRRSAGDGLVSSAGRSITTLTTEFTEARTVSLALDRIDQHDLPLDRTYRHYGSGRDVTVYVFDGGVLASHPELEGRVRRGYDAFPGEERLCNAHGTAVAGAVAGTTLGVAPEAEIVDVKMVECRRMRGTIDAIVRGTAWVLADHARHPERRAVANWSFIADTAAAIPALDTAVALLRSAGIPVVVSAGNLELDACHISPGNAPGAIVVGAARLTRSTDTSHSLTDARAPHTAFGPCIDIFAPGDSVLLPSIGTAGEPITQLWTGTSMAAGYVSGAIALFLEAHPRATPDEVGAHVRGSATASWVDDASPRAGMLYVGAAQTSRTLANR
jgi:subtilisin family serine protease